MNNTTGDRFEDRLLTAILDDFDALSSAPRQASRRLTYQQRARPGLPRMARRSATAVGAAATVAVAVAAIGHDPHTVLAVRPNTLAPAPLSARAVAFRTGQSIRSAQNYIIVASQQTTTQGGTFKSVTWIDVGNSCNFRDAEYGSDGRLAIDSTSFQSDGGGRVYAIDYRTHRYSLSTASTVAAAKLQAKIQNAKATGVVSKQPPRSAHVSSAPCSSGPDATGVARDLRVGTDQLVGPTSIDGRSALKVQNNEPGMDRQIWIDPATYLPLRMTAHGTWGSYTIDYSWTPRTPANLKADFQPDIPAGFTETTSLGGD